MNLPLNLHVGTSARKMKPRHEECVEVTCDERCAEYTDGLRATLRQLFGSASTTTINIWSTRAQTEKFVGWVLLAIHLMEAQASYI